VKEMKLKLGNVEVKLEPIQLKISPGDIRELRKVTGLSLDRFARLCDVSHSAAYFWEIGARTPGRRSREKLCEIIRSVYQQQNGEALIEKRKKESFEKWTKKPKKEFWPT
jgi:DNA-binding transcriptional regulator YiaG